jgi:hypothetical protein
MTATASTITEDQGDGSLSWFYKPHTVTALIVMLAIFCYVALFLTEGRDTVRNTKM